jgi:chromosome partition protein MukE
MSKFQALADVIMHQLFPIVDMALRKGKHIAKDDFDAYDFLMDSNHLLELFYSKYGCQLVYQNDGYFYLLPSGDQLGNRHLTAGEMLVGQALTLLYFDPNSLARGGIVTKEQVITRLVAVVGTEALIKIFHPRKKKYNEKVMGDMIRAKLSDSLRRLSALGFVEALDDDRYKLKSSLIRFAEPVRSAGDTAQALETLIAKGEVRKIADQLQSDIQAEEEAEDVEEEEEEETSQEREKRLLKEKQLQLNLEQETQSEGQGIQSEGQGIQTSKKSKKTKSESK